MVLEENYLVVDKMGFGFDNYVVDLLDIGVSVVDRKD